VAEGPRVGDPLRPDHRVEVRARPDLADTLDVVEHPVFGAGQRDTAVLFVGAAGVFVFVPWAVARWFGGKFGPGLVSALSGLLLIAFALTLTRVAGSTRHNSRT